MRSADQQSATQLLTIKEAASRLACSRANLYSLIESGEVAVVRVGARKGFRIDERDLASFIAKRKVRFEVRQRTLLPSRIAAKHLKL